MINDLSSTWIRLMHDILTEGDEVSPRGFRTKELLQKTLIVDQRRPVLRVPERQLNYRFMVAEAYWMLAGDDRVATIAPYNSKIAQFSDDGQTFFGAYGPMLRAQLDYVVTALHADCRTRQAGMTFWRKNPPKTKDVPCTIAVFFSLRHGLLHTSVFMRSSDVWLGIPYDVFNFSMLTHLVCGLLRGLGTTATPGLLRLTAASSHLYETNWDAAWRCINGHALYQTETPWILYTSPNELMAYLMVLRDDPIPPVARRWWETEN